MKRIKLLFIITAFLMTMLSSYAEVEVRWSVVENRENEGKYTYVQRLEVKNHLEVDRLCFNMFARKMKAVNPADSVMEIVPGYYCILSSRFGGVEPLVIDIETNGWIQSRNYAPDGFHALTSGGELLGVKYHRASLLTKPELRNRPGRDVMTYADSIYRLNESLRDNVPLSPYDIIPSFKGVRLMEGSFSGGVGKIGERIIDADNPEFYRITVMPDSVLIEAASEPTLAMARRIFVNQILVNGGGTLPCAVIEDYPDFHHRGLMLDVARNFTPLADIQNIVYTMASCRMNRLHFHLTDDEAWRLEIPGLPELTSVGARRGYTLDERDFLVQIFDGNGDPNSTEGTANGYYTREEFVQFLSFCHSLGIEVIPEVDVPGHSRAAIVAMRSRFLKTGDDTYLLREDCDTSRYTSAQSFHDNLMNPALPGPYRFMEKVVDEIAAMYRDAGVPLPGFHIGGDEVPEGAWDGSPSARDMMAKLGISGRHLLQGEFVRRMSKMLAEKGIRMFGWQEIGVGYDDDFNAEVAPNVAGVNCWVTNYDVNKNVALRALHAGFPVILSNVDYFYMDQLYAWHPEERGLYWGGVVDELRSLAGYADVLCPAGDDLKNNILGIQGQLFAETVRGVATVQTHLYPKMYGLAERAWNSSPTYTDARFNHIIGERVLPRMGVSGKAFHLRAPGIVVVDGNVFMNSPYPGAAIRYTVDGSEPDLDSPLYEGEFPAGNITEIRAALYYCGQRSMTSLLYR